MKKFLFLNIEDVRYPLLGPYLNALTYIGLPLKPVSSAMYLFTILIPITFLFKASMFIDIYYGDYHPKVLLPKIGKASVSMMSMLKLLLILFKRSDMIEQIEMLSEFERRQLKNETKHIVDQVNKYKNYMRIIINMYMIVCFTVQGVYFIIPVIEYIINYNQYIVLRGSLINKYPFDRNVFPYDIITYAIDSMYILHSGFCHVLCDAIVVSFMCFFAGQYEIIKIKLVSVFDTKDGRSCAKLIDLFHQYLFISRKAKRFKEIMKPMMFTISALSFIYTCLFAIQIVFASTLSEYLAGIATIVITVLQLLNYYWHSNQTLLMSTQVADGAYQSEWYSQDVQTQRTFLLFMTGLRQPFVFSAGPTYPMNTNNFLRMLKAAYSLFAMLLKTTDKGGV